MCVYCTDFSTKDQYFIIFYNQIHKIIFESKKKKKADCTVCAGKELLARATLEHMADQGHGSPGRW